MEAIDGRPLEEKADERLELIIHAAAELRLSTSPSEAPQSLHHMDSELLFSHRRT